MSSSKKPSGGMSRYVRIKGVRNGRLVEFDFLMGEDLSIEMIMPFAAFAEFCAQQQAVQLPPIEESKTEFDRLL